MQPKIEVNYRATSDIPGRECRGCSNFQPTPGTDADGRCFGAPVSRLGVCDFFTVPLAQSTQER